MKRHTQRTTGTALGSKAVVRAVFGWDAMWHQVSLGKGDPVLPFGRLSS